MWALLGLIFFSMLLTTDATLHCVICQAVSKSCTGRKVICPPEADICMSMLSETKQGEISISAIVKSCSTESACLAAQRDSKTTIGGINMTINCSKAPSSSGSFLLALSGHVLLKLLL